MEINIELSNGSTAGFKQYAKDNKNVSDKGSEMFQQSLELVEAVTNSFVQKIRGLENPPAEFAVEFGVVFKADLGAIIAKTSAEANFKINLKWTSPS